MNNTPREEFVQMFDNGSDTIIEQQTTILQALSMMNGQFVSDATGLEKSATLSAVAEFPLMTTAERIEALYLAALSRKPRARRARTAGEIRRIPEADRTTRRSRLSDVFWALLNSSEFLFNR